MPDPVRIPLPPGERFSGTGSLQFWAEGVPGIKYLARDLTLHREVVIKGCLPEGNAARSEGR